MRKNYLLAALLAASLSSNASAAPGDGLEKLSRGAVVVPSNGTAGRFISWRLLAGDNEETSFDIVRNGEVIKENIYDATSYNDTGGMPGSTYQIVVKQNLVPVETIDVEMSWDNLYKQLPLDRPEGGKTPSGEAYDYSPSDCSVGDVDGDGDYEIVVKWDPSNAHDNSQSGYTGNVYIDCYKLDGTKLWRVDLGKNIRAGAHYTQFLVYDFDGNGKAEMICKTAPGSKDNDGTYVSAAATDLVLKEKVSNRTDYRNGSGKIVSGPEYLTVFDGETGKAIHTVYYNPNRCMKLGESTGTVNWKPGGTDTDYANRCDRFLATVAHLDGLDKNPSAVMQRGYYSYTFLWAVDFDGKELKTKWLHKSLSEKEVEVVDANGNVTKKTYTKNTNPSNSGSKTAFGNGNHNLSCADVDGDGRDEIIEGACAIDHDGSLLYSTGFGHGDAIHLGDLIPSRPGLEVFEIHESSPYGWDLHDAATGEVIYWEKGGGDNGRGVAADVDKDNVGYEFWSANDGQVRSAATSEVLSATKPSMNFRIYWDGDLQDELLDGAKVEKWSRGSIDRIYPIAGKNFWDICSSSACNGSKSTPNLLADILGDWREELILWDGSTNAHLNIFTTNLKTDYRLTTLMHDHTYRMGVTWQNSAYNQPPHLGFYLPTAFPTWYAKIQPGDFTQTVAPGVEIMPIQRKWINSEKPSLLKSIAPDGTEYAGKAMDGFKFKVDQWVSKTFTLTGAPQMEGTYKFVIEGGMNKANGTVSNDTIYIICDKSSAIQEVEGPAAEPVKVAVDANTGAVRLTFGFAEPEKVRVSISSAAGALCYSASYMADSSRPVEINALAARKGGVYVVRVETPKGSVSRKVLR